MSEPKLAGATILVVEDDTGVAQTVADMLEASGYRIILASDGASAEAAMQQHPDLVVLDLMLPDVDGLVLCANLKAIADVPIIICSGTTRKRDTVLGLKLGADDFIAKPFDLYEFEARVEAVLRRSQSREQSQATTSARSPVGQSDQIRVGDLSIDRARRRVLVGEESLQLTPTEYRLLSTLASRPDEVLSREELAQTVWGYQDASSGRTIDMHIRRLRVKLSSARTASPPIVSVRGFGYKLSTEETGVERTVAG